MITVEQVPCWIVVDRISHAVATAGDPGTHALCRTFFWGVYPPKSAIKKRKHNGRICAKCRAALAVYDGKVQEPRP